ncbi:MAG: hypothetical protein U0W24_08505 [Bacteroidales bacterium]
MRHNLIYLSILIFLIFGCKDEIQPNRTDLQNILDSKKFELIIKGCHGGIVGGVGCEEEIIIFDKDTLMFKSRDKTYIRVLNESRRDSLYKYFNDLLNIHQPDKNIEKDGFGCGYHDYDYTFKNDSLKLTIKPYEGNGIYHKIQDIVKLDLWADIVNWEDNIQQLDSTDFMLFNNYKIVGIRKLIRNVNGIDKIAGLNLVTTLGDTSLTIIPAPNPHYSLKRLSPVTFVQNSSDFYDFVILPDRYIENLSESDTILNGIIGLDIQGVNFKLILPEDKLDKIHDDIYGVKSKERFLMYIKFDDNRSIVIENEGLTLEVRGSNTYNASL